MFNPPHHGEIIADSLEELGLGIRDVAHSTVQSLVTCKAAVTPEEMAVKLSKVLGSTPRLWLKLQDAYSLDKAEKAVDVSRLTHLVRKLNVV
ncbi:HigA family addiction module antidote protein [Photorhabdus khanii]|uniref:Addiction module antidote protein, HigA family n=3 Tax=Morganellaceae TaxID=1903414 RepID=A0A7X5QQ34_9GAMM|nr:HigA family addiction module antitoxin [Photorhabdus luminescens]MCW7763472.1 HigA family addiction module antitoxin [Photorhabdus luminescens subsp. venezuelensis]MQL50083.1 HigA family addiction module antidote protein [Photorhabdus khanii]NHB98379.1 addiction module antidote protein, HigA family [Photorhabdus stackebrandtii]